MDALTPPDVLTVERERFPAGQRYVEWHALFDEHFRETDNPMNIDLVGYVGMERQNRMAFFAARIGGVPVGFSSHWTYTDLNSGELAGHDGFWHVAPQYRCRGIGRRLKEAGHAWLRQMGARRTEHLSKRMTPEQMDKLGFTVWGRRYVKQL